MKIEFMLDHQSISSQRRGAVLFSIRFVAPASSEPPPASGAYCLAIDTTRPECLNLAQLYVAHFPEGSDLAIVAYDRDAEIHHDLGPVGDKGALQAYLASIEPTDGRADLSNAWLLARDELRRSPHGYRKIIFLAACEQACGRNDEFVQSLALQAAEEKISIATRCLRELSPHAQLRSVENDLGSLLATTVEELRVRLRALDFCDDIQILGDHRLRVAGDWMDVEVGNMLSREDRSLCFNLLLPELPCVDGLPFDTLENERLLEVEISYRLLTEAGFETRRQIETIKAAALQGQTASHR